MYLLVGSGFRAQGRAGRHRGARAGASTGAPHRSSATTATSSAYKRLAREHGVRERVTFAGYQDDIAPYYGAADAFVLPALYDSFPDAAMEAMACGLPVVTSTRSGAAELVTEHERASCATSRDVGCAGRGT